MCRFLVFSRLALLFWCSAHREGATFHLNHIEAYLSHFYRKSSGRFYLSILIADNHTILDNGFGRLKHHPVGASTLQGHWEEILHHAILLMVHLDTFHTVRYIDPYLARMLLSLDNAKDSHFIGEPRSSGENLY